MGTVLHLDSINAVADDAFQSPSRWGRCCIAANRCRTGSAVPVSVPFSMGTVLHRSGPESMRRQLLIVSVPFSMGTVLHLDRLSTVVDGTSSRFSPLLDGDGVASRSGSNALAIVQVSVPFSMGTVLHHCASGQLWGYLLGFSPLLDGDGVASSELIGVAASGLTSFQSPSRWGRCCIVAERIYR